MQTRAQPLEIARWGAAETARRIRAGDVSAREAVEARIERIERWNASVNALVDTAFERALAEADAADAARAAGRELGPLHGVPLTIKSSIDVEGLRCECGSRFRAGRVAERDAPLVTRLRRAGAVILGVTNTPDMLMAYETDNYLYGRTNNPFDLGLTAGGSSGGEAAAIAAGFSAGGMGSDGGGSVRVPAAFCGVAGLKPTPGLIARTGHWPACIGPGAFLGLVGPMAPRVEDLDLLLRTTMGSERHDPSCAPVAVTPMSSVDLRGVRVGYFEHDGVTPVDDETAATVRETARALAADGLQVEPVALENIREAIETWRVLFSVAGATLTKPLIQGREEELHPLSLGLFADGEAERAMTYERFLQAWVDRDRMRSYLLGVMERYSLLLGPVAATSAFEHGRRGWTHQGEQVGYPGLFTYAQLYNLTGNPAVAVRAGTTAAGTPIAVQTAGRPYEDGAALALAERIERLRGPFPGADPAAVG